MVQRLLAVAFFALSLNAAALSGDEAYRAAQSGARALRADPVRRQYRHHWVNAARRLEQIASNYPDSPRAPDALLAAAQLFEELSRVSGRSADLDQAIADWKALAESYPKHPASSAAALALGRIYLQRKQPEAARRVLTGALSRRPPASRASEMKSLLASAKKPPSRVPAEAAPPTRGSAAPPVQGRRAPTGAESHSRELLEAIARASGGAQAAEPTAAAKEPAASAAAEEPTGEDAAEPSEPGVVEAPPSKGAIGSVSPAGGRQNGDRGSSAADRAAAPDSLRRARSLRAHGSAASLAQQLGLKIHRVVLDPGHGGHDTGAIGRKGTKEKDVALAVALRVRDRLTRAGLEVILTRSDDSFLDLEERARIANDAKGDLFISIHCNSAPTKKLKGIETYTLNTSSNRYSIRLAARENASSDRAVSDLQYILADLATKANTEESSRLAGRVQQSLVAHLRSHGRPVLDLGTKEALFYVLLGVRMPAVLVETSFLSHPDEERLLSSKAYQAELAAAIANGLQEFLASRQRLAKVD